MLNIFCTGHQVWFGPDDKRNASFIDEAEWDADRADLKAFIFALRHIGPFETCSITVDSVNIYNGVTLWMKHWEKNDYNYKQVKNVDLWREVAMLYRRSIPLYLKT